VSDVVHFNSYTKLKIKNIDDLVMGKVGQTRRYYGGIDISVRDVVFHLGNYSLVWDQLISVYPRVNINY